MRRSGEPANELAYLPARSDNTTGSSSTNLILRTNCTKLIDIYCNIFLFPVFRFSLIDIASI